MGFDGLTPRGIYKGKTESIHNDIFSSEFPQGDKFHTSGTNRFGLKCQK